MLPDMNSGSGKKVQVTDMFNSIAKRYDLLNRLLSLGIDQYWRKMAVREVAAVQHLNVLDVATGTGDLAIAVSGLKTEKIVGVDVANEMLEFGRVKLKDKKLAGRIQLETGDSEALGFGTGSFDVVTCAYGVRNFEDLRAGLKEMNRVLVAGGKLVILEFSKPEKFPFRQLYHFYFKNMLPVIGKMLSKHDTAYNYLPDSVMAFPQGDEFCKILEQCGFKNAKGRPLTMGVTTLYTAFK